MNAKPVSSRIALTSLALLMLLSVGLVFVAPSGPLPAGKAIAGLPPGLALAVIKIVALAYLFKRVWNHNVYSMQWSSMFILLFLAEGSVRAASDPPPAALLGFAEAIVAALYFAAVLTILRPLKQKAKEQRAADSR